MTIGVSIWLGLEGGEEGKGEKVSRSGMAEGESRQAGLESDLRLRKGVDVFLVVGIWVWLLVLVFGDHPLAASLHCRPQTTESTADVKAL